MKKSIYTLLFAALMFAAKAQISNLGINYQAQVRNGSGVLLPDTTITLRFQLLPSQFSTQPVWQEEHNATTDKYGIASVVIGQGTRTGGTAATFSSVNFSASNFWIKVDIKNGNNFVALSPTEPLQAVPYAKAAGNAELFPAGFIMPFAGDTTKIPQGWLLCDGREVSRATYAVLYNVIGDNWGRGNNSTTFNLPDLRGQFLRGVSYNSGVDPDVSNTQRTAKFTGGNVGNNVGSYQNDAFRSHNHSTGFWTVGVGSSGTVAYRPAGFGHPDSQATTSVGGSETRPKNASVNFLIKF